MANSESKVPTKRKPTAYLYFHSSWSNTSGAASPGAAAIYGCRIMVPFKHKIKRAWFTYDVIDETGSMTAQLRKALGDNSTLPGSGTSFGQSVLLADETHVRTQEVSLSAAQISKLEDALMTYYMEIAGTNAADNIDNLALHLEVEPLGGRRAL